MNIAIIGSGYLGLVTGACLADLGFSVTCVDNNQRKIDNLHNGIIPVYEPGLDELVLDNYKACRLNFTTDFKASVEAAEAVFIAVGTPQIPGGHEPDMSQIFTVAEQLADVLNGYKVIVNKSTVPVGTAEKMAEIIAARNPKAEFDVVSNPEFLREGTAIGDTLHPDRIVIGSPSKRAADFMLDMYRHFEKELGTPIVLTSPRSAEMVKYAANSFLATKLCLMNEIASLCDACGADVHDVALGIGLDWRIGRAFLNVGPGFGGSYFPTDLNTFVDIGRKYKAPISVVETIMRSNDELQDRLAQRIVELCGGSIEGKTIGILGLAFKANTDDVRKSPSINIINRLTTRNVNIKTYDPVAMDLAPDHLNKPITYCKDAYEVADKADALVIMTEWDAFRNLDFDRLAEVMKNPLIIDYRNLYSPKDIKGKKVRYVCLGRPNIGKE